MYLPGAKVWVLNNPKTAGTSLRWWMLQTAGIDVDHWTRDSLWRESAPGQVVWDQQAGIPFAWENLNERERREAEHGNDVLRVVPVRHPVSRVLATWSSKYLSGEPGYEANLPSWMPRITKDLDSLDDVAAAFEAYVCAIANSDEPWSALNAHNWPQHALLGAYLDRHHLLVRQESLDEDLRPVRDRLVDAYGTVGPIPRINVSLLAPHPSVLTQRALAAIYSEYGRDFEVFGYEQVAPFRDLAPNLGWINDVRGRNRRYAVLHRAAMTYQREGHQLRDQRDEAIAQRGECRELLATTTRERDRLQGRLQMLRERLARRDARIRSLRATVADQTDRAGALERQLWAVTTSNSWRRTAPARSLAGALRGWLR